MSADLRGTSSDTPAAGDQPHPAGQPHGADQGPAPPAASQAAGTEARRQKYAHLIEGTGQASPRPDWPARPADQSAGTGQWPVPPATDQAAGAEARRQRYAHLTEAPSQALSRPDPPARPAGETGQAPSPEARQPHSRQKETRPPEAHALTDRRYPTLEDYQKARNAAPPAAHTGHSQGTDKPHAEGKLPTTDMAHGSGHASGAERRGTHLYPEAPQQRPAEPGRPPDPGRQPDGATITHLHWQYHGTNTDVYTDGARSAHLYSPTDTPHLRPLDSADGRPAKGDPVALPHDVSRYLSTGDRQVGIPFAGDKPEKSPGDTSDLPPSGVELLEPDDNKKSRMGRLRERAENPEVLGDTPDSTQQEYDAVHAILDARHPQGATVQAASDSPHILSPATDQPGLGDIAYASVGFTILCVELGRKINDMLKHKEEGRRDGI